MLRNLCKIPKRSFWKKKKTEL